MVLGNEIVAFKAQEKTVTLTFFEDEAQTTRQDITGWSITYDVIKSFEDKTSISTDNAVITDAANGEAFVTIAANDLDVDPGRYIYGIKIDDSSTIRNFLGDFVISDWVD